MDDPDEGLAPDGTIRTGAKLSRVSAAHRAVLDRAAELVHAEVAGATVYVYGSVATGQAVIPTSDVDLLTINLPSERAGQVSHALSGEYSELCRSVDISAAMPDDFVGPRDEAYGNRVFLRHYCVPVAGTDLDRSTADFAGDTRAARGFNGDIAQHVERWRSESEHGTADVLGRKMARKTLLAVAGLVSVHDRTWTTDRAQAVQRWSQIEPSLHADLETLLVWCPVTSQPDRPNVLRMLESTVERVVDQFASRIGLWKPNA